MRHLPEGGEIAGKVELLGTAMLKGLRKGRSLSGFGSFMTDCCQQALTSCGFMASHQVHVHNLPQQPGYLTGLDAHRDEQTSLSFGITAKDSRPFWLGIESTQVLRRQDSDHTRGKRERTVHLDDKIASGQKVPRLQDNGIACLF